MARPNRWNVETDGHRGEINLTFVPLPAVPTLPSPVPAPPPITAVPQGIYQVVFFKSQAVAVNSFERFHITIENDGPSVMRIWVDTGFHPEAQGTAPAVFLDRGQSVTLSVARLVLVRPVNFPRIRGSYVISWCCPQPEPLLTEATGLTTPR